MGTVLFIWVVIGLIGLWLHICDENVLNQNEQFVRPIAKDIIRIVIMSAPMLVVMIAAMIVQKIWSGLCQIKM